MLTLAELNGFWAITLLILGFGFLIFVHELGHFLVAKWVGIRCEQFAIGFGHAVLCYRKGIGLKVGSTESEYRKRVHEHLKAKKEKDPESLPDFNPDEPIPELMIDQAGEEVGLGETEYRLNWMPLGGYVKMRGQEDMDPTARSDDPRSFNRKPIWARTAVISAGVVMNAIFAVIFFIVAFMQGVNFPPAEIGSVAPDSPAAKATVKFVSDSSGAKESDEELTGLRPGDRVTKVDGEPTSDFVNIVIASALGKPGVPIELEVERPNLDGSGFKTLNITVTPIIDETKNQGLPSIGVAPRLDTELVKLKTFPKDARPGIAKKYKEFNLRGGMKLTHVNGKPATHDWQLHQYLQASNGTTIELTFADEDDSVAVKQTPKTQLQAELVKITNDGSETYQVVSHFLGLVPPLQIGEILEGPAKDKLMKGDIITKVGDKQWPTSGEFIDAVQKSKGAISIQVMRKGERKSFDLEPNRAWFKTPRIGVALNAANDAPMVARIHGDSPFKKALAQSPGVIIKKVAGKEIQNYSDIRIAVENAEPGEHEIVYQTDGQREPSTTKITLDEDTINIAKAQSWDIEVDDLFRQPLYEVQKAESIGAAITIGIEKTHNFMIQTYITLARLFQRTVKIKHLRGPIGIVNEGQRIARRGIQYLLFFLGLISINLAVINFLPLPIVDGGHFVLLMIEKVRGRPVSERTQTAITIAGLLMLGTLFIMVTFYDITRLFGG